MALGWQDRDINLLLIFVDVDAVPGSFTIDILDVVHLDARRRFHQLENNAFVTAKYLSKKAQSPVPIF